MGTRGPVPKRSDERRRRNQPTTPTMSGTARGGEPSELREDIHPVARSWYDALSQSGQSEFYEPSDWATAVLCAEAMDCYMRNPNASMLGQINAMMANLLVTEGARRRVSVELVREPAVADVAPVASLDDRRRRVADAT